MFGKTKEITYAETTHRRGTSLSLVTPRKGYKSVPWLFGKVIEIPEEWEVQKITELAKVNSEQINDEIQKHLNLHNQINNGVAQKMALIIDKDGNWRIQNNENL